MTNFNEYLYVYGLHDCEVSSITFKNNCLFFHFVSGVYLLDKNKKESQRTSECAMCIEIENFDYQNKEDRLEVFRIFKGKIKEIKFDSLIKTTEKYKFDINVNYFSGFGNSILLDGYSSKYRYQIHISEIKKISFIF